MTVRYGWIRDLDLDGLWDDRVQDDAVWQYDKPSMHLDGRVLA